MPKNLLDLTYTQLGEELALLGEPACRTQQVWDAVYTSLNPNISAMTTLPAKLKADLQSGYQLRSLELMREENSSDKNTTKVLLSAGDGRKLETVLMRYTERNTLCISTQSGCAMDCAFCATGQMGFFRNLSAGEIIEQVLFFAERLKQEATSVTNIVFMGMGEPFHNYDATLHAVNILKDEHGFNFGARRMTISTVGLVPQIKRFADEDNQVNLAVSLHAIDDDMRNSMMPVNKKYPVSQLLEACRYYVEKTNRRISFEWALIDRVNDTPEMASRLAQRLKPLLCHVNLIQLNPTGKFNKPGSTDARASAFKTTLERSGIPCSIRLRRGIDIHAGCGQLASITG